MIDDPRLHEQHALPGGCARDGERELAAPCTIQKPDALTDQRAEE